MAVNLSAPERKRRIFGDVEVTLQIRTPVDFVKLHLLCRRFRIPLARGAQVNGMYFVLR